MRIIKLLGLALMVTLAFSAVGAIGAGSASALVFLTESGRELLFTAKSLTKPVLETANGSKVECVLLLGHGFILHNTDKAHKILLTFHGCKNVLLGECKSTNEPAGLITTLELDALLVTLLPSIDKYGLKLLAEKGNLAEFTCGIGEAPVVVKGTVVGEFEETLKESETFKKERPLLFEKGVNPGEPAIKDYWTLEGVSTAKLEASINNAPFEEANQQVLVDIRANGGVKFDHG